jgi:DNA-directed RNA polymerase subunit RPC12/RpoP
MTISKRTLITPKDIVAVEYECGHCHSRITVPLESSDRAVTTCPNCKGQWFKSSTVPMVNQQDGQVISGLLTFLADLRARQLEGLLFAWKFLIQCLSFLPAPLPFSWGT